MTGLGVLLESLGKSPLSDLSNFYSLTREPLFLNSREPKPRVFASPGLRPESSGRAR